MRVEQLHADGTATVSLGAARTKASLALVEGVEVGDYVLVHTGHAIGRLDEAAADRTLSLFRELGVAFEAETA